MARSSGTPIAHRRPGSPGTRSFDGRGPAGFRDDEAKPKSKAPVDRADRRVGRRKTLAGLRLIGVVVLVGTRQRARLGRLGALLGERRGQLLLELEQDRKSVV